MTFSKSNDRTLKRFYEFLWNQTHPFLFIERSIFLTLGKMAYPTNYFICKEQHIYIALYRGCRYVVLDSNDEEPRFISSKQLYTELCDAPYIFMELTDTNHEDITNKIREVSDKNEYYRSRCESMMATIDMYKSISKK